MNPDTIDVPYLDTLPQPAAVHLLLTCCPSPLWAQRVAAARPVRTVSAMLRAADVALAGLPPAELDRVAAVLRPALPSDVGDSAAANYVALGRLLRVRLRRLVNDLDEGDQEWEPGESEDTST